MTLLRIGADRTVTQAKLLAEKRSMASQANDGDCFLLARRGRYQPDVLWVDNLAAAREALGADDGES